MTESVILKTRLSANHRFPSAGNLAACLQSIVRRLGRGFWKILDPSHYKEDYRMKKDSGFSLLELLIVVAIILIIATIAIPSLLRSRQAAQESSAVAQVRTINTAEVTYLSSNGGNYGSVAELITAGVLGISLFTSLSWFTSLVNT